ncbi:SRP40, C-terminal domain-containing protein [Xylaria sp. FL0064]|nr:SRP40, C-terminal domain-containing protein [Xylaria sp. FL0064]
MAKKDKKALKAARPKSEAVAEPAAPKPPAQLMDLVESFLSDQGFDDAHREFKKHRATKAWKGHSAGTTPSDHSLVSIFQTWETLPTTKAQITKASSSDHLSSDSSSDSSDESSDDDDVAMADAPAAESSSDESSSSSSDSSSESESESESDEEETTTIVHPASTIAPVTNSLKRKAESDSESSSSESDSGSDSDSDSDEDMTDVEKKTKPRPKKLKREESSDESSESVSSSESESDSEDEEAKPKINKTQPASDSSSESDSDDSSSSSESDSGSEDEVEVAAKVALPESDSESESEETKPKIKIEGSAVNAAASDSSATLEKASPDFAPLPPDPTTFKANNRGKNGPNQRKPQNQPFSRISKDVVVDPRLSSNAYVSHGYGEQAHRDLIVTRGKGFTKEKNKKKRGAYKGGPLDVHTSRSFKFDD